MNDTIEIYCENTDEAPRFALGTSLEEIARQLQIKLQYPILGAMVNNRMKELHYRIFKPKTVRFFDLTHRDGWRMYVRSLSFVLMKAVKELYPQALLRIEHSVSNGFYCEIENTSVTDQMVSNIIQRMRKIVADNLPFVSEEIRTSEAVKLFEQNNFGEKAKLFSTYPRLYTTIYRLGEQVNYFFGALAPSSGYITVFDLVKYHEGMLLRLPDRYNPAQVAPLVEQSKMFEIFREYKRWGKVLGASSIGNINELINNGQAGELIKISEALHEKKVAHIADAINSRRDQIRLILISGPSSSGKTTFAKRLAIQLKVAGIMPVHISLDDYFVDREKTPLDEKGEYDFESLEALDVPQFNADLLRLLAGNEVELPRFSFQQGKRYYDGHKLRMHDNEVLIVEGIHGLNPKLTAQIDNAMKFKIYVSALTQLGIDGHNRIPSTDNRLLRRMIRDYQYRGYSALDTIRRWASVRRGEDRHIFPYQEEADVMFNSALLFEFSVIKRYVEPLLNAIEQNLPEHSEAQRLLKFLSYFTAIHDERDIPPTSILREFLQGSTFKY